MQPRDDQLAVINTAITHIAEGNDTVLIQAPTGWGKSLVLVLILARLIANFGAGARVTWVAHRDRLLYQAFRSMFTIAPQLLRNTTFIGIASPRIPPCDVLVVDEAHHDAARSYHAARDKASPNIVIAATATPTRHDRYQLNFSKIIAAPKLDSLIEAKVLSPFDHFALCGDMDPARMVDAIIAEPDRWRQSLVFMSDIGQAHLATNRLRAAGIAAAPALGDQTKELVTSAFICGNLQVLLTVHALSEGVDIASVQSVFIRDGQRTAVLQAIGRALRRDGNKLAHVVQYADARIPFFNIAKPHRRFAGTPGSWVQLPAVPLWHEQAAINRRQIAMRFTNNPPAGKE